MKHIMFYQEFENKARTQPSGNCVAVIPANRCPDGSLEAIGAVYFHPDSPVASTSVSLDYLRQKCKRISEAKARRIHPNLFEQLDA